LAQPLQLVTLVTKSTELSASSAPDQFAQPAPTPLEQCSRGIARTVSCLIVQSLIAFSAMQEDPNATVVILATQFWEIIHVESLPATSSIA